MFFINFIFRHIIRHWGMNLAVLIGLSIGAGLLGSLPTFASATAAKALDVSISNAHPSVRNLKVEAPPAILTSALNSYIIETIDELVSERIFIRNVKLDANPSAPIIISEQEVGADLAEIWIWSLDKLTHHVNLLNGDWPVVTYPQSQAEAFKPPTIQTVITEDVAKGSGLKIGDQLQDSNEFKFLITGIVEIVNPEDDIWWQDRSSFLITREPGLNEDRNILPVFISSQSMKEYLPAHSGEWRYILNAKVITSNNVGEVGENLKNLKIRISANHAKMTTGLTDLIEEYRGYLSTSRMVMYLLSSQAFLFVVFTLILMSAMLVNNSQSDIAIMTSRGASRGQILITFSVQIFFLAVIAGLLLGPLLTKLGLMTWGWYSGDNIPPNLPYETWQMSILAAGIGWLAVVLSIIPATRSSVLEYQQAVGRPGRWTFWQKSYLDIFLLVLGVIFFWQLSNSGSFVMRRFQGTTIADPLLLIGPSLLTIALAMIFLRLFPLILNGLAILAKAGRGIILPLGLTKIARNPSQLSWVILLVSMAAGLILFANIYSESLFDTQNQIAKYQAGSDIRLDMNKITSTHLAAVAEHLPTSRVLRGRVYEGSGLGGITILAVDPDTFVKVAEYPTGMTNLTIDIIMQALREPAKLNTESTSESNNPYTGQWEATDPIPTIFSYSVIRKNGKIGDQIVLLINGQPVTFEVRGIIADFPTLTTDFVIVNSKIFEDVISSPIAAQIQNPEAWISTAGYDHNQVVSFPFIANSILADAREALNLMRNNIMTLGTVRAFGLNAIILTVISFVGLILANYFSIRERSFEFGILRALGLTHGQSNQLVMGEGILVLILGLASGLLLGYILTKLMRPYISMAVARDLPGMVVHQININWQSVAVVIALLTISYAIATALIIFSLWKTDLQQELRIGVE